MRSIFGRVGHYRDFHSRLGITPGQSLIMGIGSGFLPGLRGPFGPAMALNRSWARRGVESPRDERSPSFRADLLAGFALPRGAMAGCAGLGRLSARAFSRLHDGLFGERRSLGFARDDGKGTSGSPGGEESRAGGVSRDSGTFGLRCRWHRHFTGPTRVGICGTIGTRVMRDDRGLRCFQGFRYHLPPGPRRAEGALEPGRRSEARAPGGSGRGLRHEAGEAPADDLLGLAHDAVDQLLHRRHVVDQADHHAA